MIYYIAAPSLGLVKIGLAQNVRRRLNTIAANSPVEVALLAIEEGARELELERHRQFDHLRVRGEWFRFEGELASHVERLPNAPEEMTRPFRGKARDKALGGKLGAWIVENGHTATSFARLLGLRNSVIFRICNEGYRPSSITAATIVEATGRAVTASDMGWPDKFEGRAA